MSRALARGLQPAPAQGAQLLPDHGVRGEHGPGAQGLQPGRQCSRRPGLAGVSWRVVQTAACDAQTPAGAGDAHGRGVFPCGCDQCVGGRGCRIRDQGAVLGLAGAQGTHRQTPNMGACGRHGGMFRSVALGADLVTRDACRGLPQACASPDGKELPTGSLNHDDGYYEYSAIVTNREVAGRTL